MTLSRARDSFGTNAICALALIFLKDGNNVICEKDSPSVNSVHSSTNDIKGCRVVISKICVTQFQFQDIVYHIHEYGIGDGLM